MNEEALKWQKRFERERIARKESEYLLESKSLELYKLNESLKEKIKEEIEKNRQKDFLMFQQSKMASMGEMLANIAHQWRQPLSAISTLATSSIIEDELGILDNKTSVEHFEKIMKFTNFLSKTIDDFSDFFKTNKEKILFEPCEIIEQALIILNNQIKKNDIHIIKELSNFEITNLHSEFMQVILNLIKNAIDVLIQSDVLSKYIFIKTYCDENFYFIEILDNAGGIPNEHLSKIFDPYFTTKHKSQGTGLGLYMSIEIVNNHMNGELSVENREFEIDNTKTKGACFTIKLPKI